MLCLSGLPSFPRYRTGQKCRCSASEVAVTLTCTRISCGSRARILAASASRQPEAACRLTAGGSLTEGDALELLSELARLRGQQFSWQRRASSPPVSLHVRDMTFADALVSQRPTDCLAGSPLTVSRAFTSFLYANGEK